MSYRETDVVYEADKAWVLCDKKNDRYTVFTNGLTHSTSDSSYPLSDDGLSVATARANYISTRFASHPFARTSS